jgi:epoxyqueuosine reductase
MPDMAREIIAKAKALGATMAGIADVESLKGAPSSELLRTAGTRIDGVHWKPGEAAVTEIRWPENAASALIIAVAHPEEEPGLDYWADTRGGTHGNRILMDINRKLSSWIDETFHIKTHRMPYGVDSGGIYLKDAAVLAGLGCIGRNNLLVTPTHGSKVRLRALLIEAALTPTGPIDFDPCRDCAAFCRRACPQEALERQVHDAGQIGIPDLPGRDGTYSRARCKIQMDWDVKSSVDPPRKGDPATGEGADDVLSMRHVRYCRQCEFACPVGNQSQSGS